MKIFVDDMPISPLDCLFAGECYGTCFFDRDGCSLPRHDECPYLREYSSADAAFGDMAEPTETASNDD